MLVGYVHMYREDQFKKKEPYTVQLVFARKDANLLLLLFEAKNVVFHWHHLNSWRALRCASHVCHTLDAVLSKCRPHPLQKKKFLAPSPPPHLSLVKWNSFQEVSPIYGSFFSSLCVFIREIPVRACIFSVQCARVQGRDH